MLKGTTKIELIDTRNKHVDTYEKHNMFTNGIQELLSYTSVLDNKKFEDDINSSGQQIQNYKGVLGNDEYNTLDYFTGGLLLFSDYINEDENQLVIPKDNEIVGRACLEDNESTQMGEKNGSFTNGFYTNTKTYSQVWEFNENQAVGTISSVALTNPLGAVLSPIDKTDSDITYENKYPYNQVNWESVCDGNGNSTNTTLLDGYQRNGDDKEQVYANYSGYGYITYSDRPASYFKNGIVLVDGRNNCLYTLKPDVSNPTQTTIDLHNIVLNKYRLPYNNFSIFDNRDFKYKDEDVIGTVTLQIPQDIEVPTTSYMGSTNARMFFSNDDSYLYLYVFSNVSGYVNTNLHNLHTNYAINISSESSYYQNCSKIFKFSLSDFSFVKYWNVGYLTNIDKNICSWRACYFSSDGYWTGIINSGYSSLLGNYVKDICVFNDKLYFFGKTTQDTYPQEYIDLILYCYDLDNGWIKEVKYNGQSIKIRETPQDWDDVKINNLGATKGSYDGYDFSLGDPFVSMINSNDSLYITFLCNGKTLVINNTSHRESDNEIAYIKYKNKINNPFWLNEKLELDEPIVESGYTLNFLHNPANENIFYIVGSNNLFLKSKSKYNKTMEDTENWTASGNTNHKAIQQNGVQTYCVKMYTNDYNGTSLYRFPCDYGCYDIFYDPTILITINNLSEPVEKTDYQKMRVTYTITEE